MCRCGYLSGVRCRLFAYGLADATASQNPIISCIMKSRLVLSFWYRLTQGPDLQYILRQSYDYLTIMPKLQSTNDGRLIYKTCIGKIHVQNRNIVGDRVRFEPERTGTPFLLFF